VKWTSFLLQDFLSPTASRWPSGFFSLVPTSVYSPEATPIPSPLPCFCVSAVLRNVRPFPFHSGTAFWVFLPPVEIVFFPFFVLRATFWQTPPRRLPPLFSFDEMRMLFVKTNAVYIFFSFSPLQRVYLDLDLSAPLPRKPWATLIFLCSTGRHPLLPPFPMKRRPPAPDAFTPYTLPLFLPYQVRPSLSLLSIKDIFLLFSSHRLGDIGHLPLPMSSSLSSWPQHEPTVQVPLLSAKELSGVVLCQINED